MQNNFSELLERFKLPLGLSLVGIVLIIGGIFTSNLTKQKPAAYPKESLIEAPKMISVDVSGALQKPGVYKLKDGSRIEDAVKIAGGFTEKAHEEYISKYLNMAQKLSDGSKVYVPSEGEQLSAGQGGGSQVAGAQIQQKVNLNTASQSELEALPGIGPVTASKIISGRPYQETGELLGKKILGKTAFEKIKDTLTVY